MHIHILGICGTFMGGIAAIAREAGHTVTGSDTAVYPPMSTQLEALGIELWEGYEPAHLQPAPDMVIVGNVVTRGNAAMEYVLNNRLPYTSGPQWLAEHVLQSQRVLAVAGTHGKTTTSSMLAWILDANGLQPGFLIGGVPGNFSLSARLGAGEWFVIEADEYDTAFFDKRSKFVHYRPQVAVLNNLEFDHADIFPDLAAIQRQFHHLVRTIPSEGTVIANQQAPALDEVLKMGCWSHVQHFASGDWTIEAQQPAWEAFTVFFQGAEQGCVQWSQCGHHNALNGLAAIAAAHAAGVPIVQAIDALNSFAGVKRRLELRGVASGVAVYDDFAHHPTAITETVQALRAKVGEQRLIVVLEPRSNTMRLGHHKDAIAPALNGADEVFLFQPSGLDWGLDSVAAEVTAPTHVVQQVDDLVLQLLAHTVAGEHVLIMSNGSFEGLHDKLLEALAAK